MHDARFLNSVSTEQILNTGRFSSSNNVIDVHSRTKIQEEKPQRKLMRNAEQKMTDAIFKHKLFELQKRQLRYRFKNTSLIAAAITPGSQN